MDRARVALGVEVERLERRFEAAHEALSVRVASARDPLERLDSERELARLEEARDATYASLADHVLANVDAQVLAALNAQCREVAEAFAPPVMWPDPRAIEVPEEEVAELAPARRAEPAM
jgi:hypothetical protein